MAEELSTLGSGESVGKEAGHEMDMLYIVRCNRNHRPRCQLKMLNTKLGQGFEDSG